MNFRVRSFAFLGTLGLSLPNIAGCSAAASSTPSNANGAASGVSSTGGAGSAYDPGQSGTAGNGSTGDNTVDALQNGKLVLTGHIRDFHTAFPDMEPCQHDPKKLCDIGALLTIEENTTPANPERSCNGPYTLNGVNYPSTCIVQTTLDTSTTTPVYAATSLGTVTTTGPDNFAWWFKKDDAGVVNQEGPIAIALDPNGDGTFTFNSTAFFPIDGQYFGNEGDPHNYHFTTDFHLTFTYQPGQTFYFSGDDDLWVFIDNKLVVDRGGIHNALDSTLDLDKLGLVAEQDYQFDLFYCERHVTKSDLTITTSMKFNKSVIVN